MGSVELFLNNKFKVLKTLYEHQIDINGVILCPITQQELANIIGCSKTKINVVLSELTEKQYVQMYNNTKGRYILSEESIKVIKKLT